MQKKSVVVDQQAKTLMKNLALLLGCCLYFSGFAYAEGYNIRVVGSSTLYPFITIIAEKFGRKTEFKTPVIEATGTGGGLKLFCQGNDNAYPGIAAASRPIKENERKLCKAHGITDIKELKIGYDGIILASSKRMPQYKLTSEQLFLALAKMVPKNGKLVENYYKKWSEIDHNLPHEYITVYGPPVTSGTRNSFVEIIMQKNCENIPEFISAYPTINERKEACGILREDGGFVEVGENDNLIIQKLAHTPYALGIFGYNFLEQNSNLVHAATINGIAPDRYTIASGLYPISRPLYLYIKTAHLKTENGMNEFISAIFNEDAIGNNGYLVKRGLVPMAKKDLDQIAKELDLDQK